MVTLKNLCHLDNSIELACRTTKQLLLSAWRESNVEIRDISFRVTQKGVFTSGLILGKLCFSYLLYL